VIALLLAAGLSLAPPPETHSDPTAESDASELPTQERPSGPPYYTDADMAELRARFDIELEPPEPPEPPRWRCLTADPRCGFGVELLASTAYTYRTRQGDISLERAYYGWNSARVSYELWINFPAHTEVQGRYKFTRFTLGPKLGVVASDNADLWGNFGVAGRYWFGRGPWAPAIEFSSAISFKLMGEEPDVDIQPQRSPVGITADVGINIGGWGAIIVGGQFDAPLAREDLPEKFRASSAGQVFVGFRGNILWGGPAAIALGTHIGINRSAVVQP